jgi:hypothetical protein
MTIPNSNFGMNNIRDEYGGDRPDAISEYYRNGPHVKNWAASQNIPTDGTIAWSRFRGQTATSGLDSAAVMRYIWDNKFDLFRLTNMGQSGVTVGNRPFNFRYPFDSYLKGGEPNGNVSWQRSAKTGSGNGNADLRSASNKVYLGPTTTFLYFSSGYGVGVPWSTLTAFDKNNNQVQLDEIFSTQEGRRELRVLRCNSTDYTNMGCFVASGGSNFDTRPTFGAVFMLPGQWDVWSSDVINCSNPGSSPTYFTIETPPNGIAVWQSGALGVDGIDNTVINGTTENPSGNPNPLEANSRKYIKMNMWWYRNLSACLIFGTDGYETTTWKHRIGNTYYRPFAGSSDPSNFSLVKLQKTGN